jgi:hypothetical protein
LTLGNSEESGIDRSLIDLFSMPGHGKWRASNSPDYLPLLNNFAARGFLVSSRPSVSFIRAFNPFSINNLNFFRIFSQSDLFFFMA